MPKELSDGTGYVYLMRGQNDQYRIGYTSTIIQRLRSWRWQSGARQYGLIILALIRSSRPRQTEKLLHAIFRDKQTEQRHNGMGPRHEWFFLSHHDLALFRKWAPIVGEDVTYTSLNLSDPDWLNELREVVNA